MHWFTGPVRTIDDPTAGGHHGGHGHGDGHMPHNEKIERVSGDSDPEEKKGDGEKVTSNVY